MSKELIFLELACWVHIFLNYCLKDRKNFEIPERESSKYILNCFAECPRSQDDNVIFYPIFAHTLLAYRMIDIYNYKNVNLCNI